MCELPSHAEALDKALKAEWIREQMKSDQKSGKKRTQQVNRQDIKKEEGTNKQNRRNDKCERCGRDHETKDCPQTTSACFQCGRQGHLIENCP